MATSSINSSISTLNDNLAESLTSRSLKLTFYAVIFVTSVIGNTLVCLVVCRQQRLRTSTNYYIVNLACADLAVTIICIPFDVILQENGYVWPFGQFLCRIVYPLMTMSTFASVGTLTAIALNRYNAVSRAMRVRASKKVAKIAIGVIWLCSFGAVLPYILILNVNEDSECVEIWSADWRKAYTVFIFVFQYLIPLTVITIAYIIIGILLHENRSNLTAAHRRQDKDVAKVSRMMVIVGVIAVLCMVPVLLFGASRLKTTLGPENMFHPGSQVRVNHDWLEENLTPVQCLEIVATFENDERGRLTPQVDSLQEIQAQLLKLPEIKSIFSFASLCDPIPQGRDFRSVSKRSFIDTRIKNEMPKLVHQRLIVQEGGLTHWRIRVGLNIEDEERYATLMQDIALAADESAVSMDTEPEFLVTGIWPLSAIGRQQLFSDLATSFGLAFLMITPLIMLILRGVRTGLVAMLPNIFPALLFFGGMGWLGWSVDIGTILTASVGLGIAVDDTLHFLETYVRTRKKTCDRSKAVWMAITHCGRPMLYTTLICCTGLAVFAASQFIPARQFAVAIVVLLCLALVSDLLLLPALILGPFGKLFDRKQSVLVEDETMDLESEPSRRAA